MTEMFITRYLTSAAAAAAADGAEQTKTSYRHHDHGAARSRLLLAAAGNAPMKRRASAQSQRFCAALYAARETMFSQKLPGTLVGSRIFIKPERRTFTKFQWSTDRHAYSARETLDASGLLREL